MSINYKIILNYIKDISLEIPDADTLIVTRQNISKYLTDIQISTKIMKNNMIEVDTKLIYYDKTKNKKKTHFELIYSTVLQLKENKPKKEDVKKLILCDLQIEIYPKIKEVFQSILRMSGFSKIEAKDVDFKKMYREKFT